MYDKITVTTDPQLQAIELSVPQIEYPLGAVAKKVVMYTSCCKFSG